MELPYYNFKKGEREYKGDFLKLGKEDILVIEGIHCLNDRLSYSLPRESKFKIYISALTQLNIDEHNRIPTTDGRLLRRMIPGCKDKGNFCPGYHSYVAVCAKRRRGKHFSISGRGRCYV